VGYGLEVRGLSIDKRRQKAYEVLQLVGLDGWEDRFPHELSGGMQQRVGLARALAVDPEIMLCDEPFSALDPLIRRDMQDELLNLQRNLQKTIIFITHDFLEAIKLGERIAIMKDGEIVQIGTAQQIVANPVNEYVREFTQDVPRAKVLTAEVVMKSVDQSQQFLDEPIAYNTTLEALLPRISNCDRLLPVIDQSENIIGALDRHTVLMALAES
jgi:glycine betaine/proline transport system ATP-binding protein